MKYILTAVLIAGCLISGPARADQFADYYYSAKRNIDPRLFQRADYLADGFGRPFLYVEKPVESKALVGISSDEQDDYDDSTVSPWVYDATDLALQITHWKVMAGRLGIPEDVWRDTLIAYEDYQLGRIRWATVGWA